jgi:hypothetical protein
MHTCLTHSGRKHIGGAFTPQVTPVIRKLKCIISLNPTQKKVEQREDVSMFVLFLAQSCWLSWCPQFQWYSPHQMICATDKHLFSIEHTFKWWFMHTPISRHERVLFVSPGRCYQDSNPCANAIAQF